MKIDLGKAFEYACIISLADIIKGKTAEIGVEMDESSSFNIAKSNFNLVLLNNAPYAEKLLKAGKKIGEIILSAEPKLYIREPSFQKAITLSIQPDSQGISGDVRDIIAVKVSANGKIFWEIGVSCKHNNDAVKHQRISQTIDFGKIWLDLPLQKEDFQKLKGIFDQVDQEIKIGNTKWHQVGGKEERFYVSVLKLILEKIDSHPDKGHLAEHLLKYLLGVKDFYKVIYYPAGGTIHIQAFNFSGTLNKNAETFGHAPLTVNKIHFPTRIINHNFKPNSKNTIEVFFDRGWQISMRIHNASTALEKSLKMDVRLKGVPNDLFTFVNSL